jgi:hypothetical protein
MSLWIGPGRMIAIPMMAGSGFVPENAIASDGQRTTRELGEHQTTQPTSRRTATTISGSRS